MRILLYGMQTSGASLITLFLGQIPRSVALVDVWARHLAPPLPSGGASAVIAKCVVTTEFAFDDHVRSFRPDRTILVLRHPVQNYNSLRRKGYANEGGPIDAKFARLEETYADRARFDLVLTYEQFIRDQDETVAALRAIDVPSVRDHYRFPRSVEQIKKFNFRHDPWCREQLGRAWHYGNVRGSQLDPATLQRPFPADVEAHVRPLCPTICAHYDERYAWLRESPAASEVPVPAARRPGFLRRIQARLGLGDR